MFRVSLFRVEIEKIDNITVSDVTLFPTRTVTKGLKRSVPRDYQNLLFM